MNIEVQKIGLFRWEWRYKSPRYRQFGRVMSWTEWATGQALTRWGAIRAAKLNQAREAREDKSWAR